MVKALFSRGTGAQAVLEIFAQAESAAGSGCVQAVQDGRRVPNRFHPKIPPWPGPSGSTRIGRRDSARTPSSDRSGTSMPAASDWLRLGSRCGSGLRGSRAAERVRETWTEASKYHDTGACAPLEASRSTALPIRFSAGPGDCGGIPARQIFARRLRQMPGSANIKPPTTIRATLRAEPRPCRADSGHL
jgi:hypothetical protein